MKLDHEWCNEFSLWMLKNVWKCYKNAKKKHIKNIKSNTWINSMVENKKYLWDILKEYSQ